MSQGVFVDMTGQVYGKLTVISRADKNNSGHVKWLCVCECGNTKVITGMSMRQGNSTSCGCVVREISSKRFLEMHANTDYVNTGRTHGMSGTPTYRSYTSMLSRCHNPNNKIYKYYGGKGVTVYDRWIGKGGFENFLEDVGVRPSDDFSLERKDGTKGYSPDNVVWATDTEQARNRAMYSSNKSGKTGVSYIDFPPGWKAYISDPDTKKVITKTYSISKWGEAAFQMACDKRDELFAEINARGAGYSKAHGK